MPDDTKVCDRCGEYHQRLFPCLNQANPSRGDIRNEMVCRKCLAELIADYLKVEATIESQIIGG